MFFPSDLPSTGLGSIQKELELINSIPIPELEHELELKDLEHEWELKDLEQNELQLKYFLLNWNEKELSIWYFL